MKAADRQGVGFRDIDDAPQCFKIGATDDRQPVEEGLPGDTYRLPLQPLVL
jgi:hypothetical protein